MDDFTTEEQLIILEAARIALSDADIFDSLADQMDVADDVLKEIQEKLSSYMQSIE